MLRLFLITFSVLFFSLSTPTFSQTNKCIDSSVNIITKYSKTGKMVWEKMKTRDKKFFYYWLDCKGDERISSLATAIHESVHFLTEVYNGYLQIDGSIVKRPKYPHSFPTPNRVGKVFSASDDYAKIYARPGKESASSNKEFIFLLDEFNAYTLDLQSTIELVPSDPKVSKRDNFYTEGFMFFLAFKAAYLNSMVNSDHWYKFENEREGITKLWIQAEMVYNRVCKMPYLGQKKSKYTPIINSHKRGIETLLGRKINFQC